MAGVFAITTANDRLSVGLNGRGEAVFTVTNTTARPQRALAKVKAFGDTKLEWLKLAGERERDLSAGATEQFLVDFSPPPTTRAGRYSFRLDVVSARNPDEDFTEGPIVTAEILPSKPKPPSKAWLIPVGLIAALVIGATILLIVTRRKNVQVQSPRPPAKPVVRIVTLGHETAGKSTLTSAITKVLSKSGAARFVPYDQIADPPEGTVQGVSVTAAQVEYDTEKAHYIHLDCHSNADYEKLLNSEGVILDGAILVVSAVDGPMPQTREHILLAQKKGLKSIVVYLNKMDLVTDPELQQLVELEIKELLAAYDFKGDKVSIIPGSALMALNGANDNIGKDSILQLLTALDRHYVK